MSSAAAWSKWYRRPRSVTATGACGLAVGDSARVAEGRRLPSHRRGRLPWSIRHRFTANRLFEALRRIPSRSSPLSVQQLEAIAPESQALVDRAMEMAKANASVLTPSVMPAACTGGEQRRAESKVHQRRGRSLRRKSTLLSIGPAKRLARPRCSLADRHRRPRRLTTP